MMSNERRTLRLATPAPNEDEVARICMECGLTPLTARLLVSRGFTTPQAVQRFLAPSIERDWLDPALIPGLVEAADRVEQAIAAHERILVFGDFDVDGITATAVSVRGLRELGADAHGLIPHRYEEGYALSEAALRRGIAECAPSLVLTVDCGISCGPEVELARSLGLDVVITDHHEPGELVPVGVPVADPKLDPECPSRDLAGCGVALKLLDLLGQRLGRPDVWRSLTEYAALGTIADLMPLTSENRALVAHGIRRINTDARVGLAALAAIANVTCEEITSTRLSFSLIPRLNAAGRMGDASVALDLLMADDIAEAQRLASALDEVNTRRRAAEAELTAVVEAQLEESFKGEAAIVVAGEGWHEGVKGIVASRISRKYQRPTLVFSINGDEARGSGRTHGSVNLFDLASSASDLFTKFGGHAAAVGITLPASKLDEFGRRLCAALEDRVGTGVSEDVPVDAFVTLGECTVDAFQELERLQPFGNGNTLPILGLRNVFMERRAVCGKTDNHLRFNASDGADRVAAIWFNTPDIERMAACEAPVDIAFEASVDEWQRRLSAKIMAKDVIAHDDAAPIPEDDLTESLLACEEDFLEVGDYAGIAQAQWFNTKVAGVTFEGRQDLLATLTPGTALALVRQPDNPHDENAVAVQLADGRQVGYLNRRLAARLAPVMDGGQEYRAEVTEVTGGGLDRAFGVNILVAKEGTELDVWQSPEELRLEPGRAKEQWRQVDPAELDERIREALIGQHSLHDAQRRALAHLAAGRSTFAVMATGRGKSLIFHMHAARTALRRNQASIFVYPLRALVADQAFHLQETYARFGLGVQVLTGETDLEEREEVYRALETGHIDVILTTPEFLGLHASRFAATGKVGFVVVDEAHHIGQSRAGNRPAYAALGATLEALGSPLVLAVTATAGQEEAALICETLKIQELVLDPTVRENLKVDDRRDLRDRESYLASVAACGGKTIAYVNSRQQSMQLTRMLRHRLPALAPRIAFYHAGLPKADRKRIEGAFRSGELSCIVSTSAFGEGIDIPDVEHVVLYHLPFSDIEFNQMSGRAGRDGREAVVHLLYGGADARINEAILSSSAPPRAQMVALYRVLSRRMAEAVERGEDSFAATNSELAEQAVQLDRSARMDESAVSCGIAVFRELGFLETQGASVARRIRMVDGPARMELSDSARYSEGQEQERRFADFKEWACSAAADELLSRFNRPILPAEPEALLHF